MIILTILLIVDNKIGNNTMKLQTEDRAINRIKTRTNIFIKVISIFCLVAFSLGILYFGMLLYYNPFNDMVKNLLIINLIGLLAYYFIYTNEA